MTFYSRTSQHATGYSRAAFIMHDNPSRGVTVIVVCRVQLYSLVARGKTVLAEFTFTTGNFPTITRVLLAKIPPEDTKMSYVYDQ